MGMFDDLIPTTQAALSPQPAPAPVPAPGGGMFDDLIPKGPAAAPAPAAAAPPQYKHHGFWLSEKQDGTFEPGSLIKPIVEGVKGALPAAARYQGMQGGDAAAEAVIKPIFDASPLALTGAIPSVARSVISKIPPARQLATEVPGASGPIERIAVKDLHAAGTQAYKESEQAGVIFTPEAMGNLRNEVNKELAEFAYNPGLQPKVPHVLAEIDRLAEGNVTLKGVDTLRKMVGHLYDSAEKSERALAGKISSKIDDMIMNPSAAEVLTGDAAAGAKSITEARNLWSRMRKTQLIEEAIENSGLRAASTGSGGNANNALRQTLRGIIQKPSTSRMFSKEELGLMTEVVRGTKGGNLARLVGKLSPEGNGLMLALSLAATLHTPGAAAAPLVGWIAKRIADRSTAKGAENLLRTVSSGRLEAPLAGWDKTVVRFTKGEMSEPALRMTALAVAQQIAGITGIDQNEILEQLMASAKKRGET